MNLLLTYILLTRFFDKSEVYFQSKLLKDPGGVEPLKIDENLLLSLAASNDSFDYEKYAGEKCLRTCDSTTKPRLCYFHFVAEMYQAMGSICKSCSAGVQADCLHKQCISADGFERGVMSINRQVPGPDIQVCVGDEIVVDVVNNIPGAAISLHWHGFKQRETPFMDGVPYVNQCPILYSSTFRYRFKAAKPGTFLYHSHSGHHKINGQYGALIVRGPKEKELNSKHYNFDDPQHVLVASDWLHKYADEYVPGPPSNTLSIDSLLLNGRGRYLNPTTRVHLNAPLAFFRVKKGGKYRFRYINGESHSCPIQFQIENHRMLVISADGFAVRPVMVDTIYSLSGERYDFVLDANQTSGNYFIRLRSIGYCEDKPIEVFGVLTYQGVEASDLESSFPQRELPFYNVTYPIGINLNFPNYTACALDKSCIPASNLQAYDRYQDSVELAQAPVDHRFLIDFSTLILEHGEFFDVDHYFNFMTVFRELIIIASCNNISFVAPPFNLLAEKDRIDDSMFCNNDERPATCNKYYCFCTHRLKVELNSVVEMLVYDNTVGIIRAVHHPLHLHGNHFLLTGMGQENEITSDKLPSASSNPSPSFRDTVTVPSRGYAKIKFRADNPGFWLFHCHFEWHMGIGMSLLLQVGEPDEMVPTPVGFPTCGNYKPDLYEL